MKILVTGSKGQLGSEIQLLSEKSDHDFIFTDIEELNLCNESEVVSFFDNNQLDIVINCAAYTAVDKAESEIDKALMVNASAPRILAENCMIKGAILLHISTDFVFNGRTHLPYTESDPVAPVNVYGQTKLEGENRLLKENPRSCIVRTSWLYSSTGQNFVHTMLRLSETNKEIKVIYDQIGTPTYAGDLAMALLQMADSFRSNHRNENLWGIYHYSNEGVASWYDFAYEIFRLKNRKINVIPIRSSDYPTPASRPHFSVLDKQKIKNTFDLDIPHWKDSLEKCLSLMD